MKRVLILALAFGAFAAAASAGAQGIMGDVLAGNLIEPEVGVFAWYDLTDAQTGAKVALRQAIVGEERIRRERGYWVETELIPEVGFPAVYKMLLTGPANESGNVHKIVVRESQQPAQEIPVDPEDDFELSVTGGERERIGVEQVHTAQGPIEAERFRIKDNGEVTEVWLSEEVRPMGIVRMISPQGELVLRRHGKGGPDAESALDRGHAATPKPNRGREVEVRVEGETDGPTTNFRGRGTE